MKSEYIFANFEINSQFALQCNEAMHHSGEAVLVEDNRRWLTTRKPQHQSTASLRHPGIWCHPILPSKEFHYHPPPKLHDVPLVLVIPFLKFLIKIKLIINQPLSDTFQI